MLQNDNISEGTGVNKTNVSKNVMFVNIGILKILVLSMIVMTLQWLSWFNVKSYAF